MLKIYKRIILVIIIMLSVHFFYCSNNKNIDISIESKNNSNIYDIIKTKNKTVYLTFDDGPSKNTIKILKILDKYNAKATFFFVASKLSSYKKQIKTVYLSGNGIASHSFAHSPDEVYNSFDDFKKDVSLWQDTFKAEFGIAPNIYRFPYGSNNHHIYLRSDKNCLARLASKYLLENGITYVDWNVTSTDGTLESQAEQIYNTVIKGMDEKSVPIVLLHEWNDNTMSALNDILDYGTKKGYIFEVLKKDMKMPRFVE